MACAGPGEAISTNRPVTPNPIVILPDDGWTERAGEDDAGNQPE